MVRAVRGEGAFTAAMDATASMAAMAASMQRREHMSDETTTTQGGSTAGLREAALARRAAKQEAKAAPAKPASEGPAFVKGKPTPSADAVADDEARQQHRKLPTRAREAANDNGDEPDVEALADDASEATGETIKIGEHEIPVSVLEQLPDEALRRIKRKLKAGGEELEVTLLDALNEVPKARGWQKRMWEAAQREKKLEQIAQSMGRDTIGAYMALHGVTRQQALDALSQQLLGELDREQSLAKMTPEERARYERMHELEAKAARAEELERKEREREQSAAAERQRKQVLADMTPALEAAGIRPSAYAIQRVAMTLDVAMRDGVIRALDADAVRWAAEEVAKEVTAERDADLDGDGDALIAKIGETRAREIAKAYAKRVQSRQQPVRSASAQPRKQASSGRPQFRTFSEFQKWSNEQARKRDRARGIR